MGSFCQSGCALIEWAEDPNEVIMNPVLKPSDSFKTIEHHDQMDEFYSGLRTASETRTADRRRSLFLSSQTGDNPLGR